jgi:formamidopyrimidine-DNA glycosylase
LIFTSGDVSDETALRIHFGMSGSIHTDGPDPTYLSSKKLALSLHFPAGARLRVFDSTVTVTDAAAARAKVQANQNKDVCAPTPVWDEAAAFNSLRAAPPSLDIATAVLDQDQSPGTGNIIKNGTPPPPPPPQPQPPLTPQPAHPPRGAPPGRRVS